MVCRGLDGNESEALHPASTSSRTSPALAIKGRSLEQTRARQSREQGRGLPRSRNNTGLIEAKPRPAGLSAKLRRPPA